jgi:hypothetical protein
MSQRTSGWNEVSFSLACAIHCLARGQQFNFSAFILRNMLDNITKSKTPFAMYPRFLQIIINKELGTLPQKPSVFIPSNHDSLVFVSMKKISEAWKAKVKFHDLFDNMLVASRQEGDNAANPVVVEPTPSSPKSPHTETTPASHPSHPTKDGKVSTSDTPTGSLETRAPEMPGRAAHRSARRKSVRFPPTGSLVPKPKPTTHSGSQHLSEHSKGTPQ